MRGVRAETAPDGLGATCRIDELVLLGPRNVDGSTPAGASYAGALASASASAASTMASATASATATARATEGPTATGAAAAVRWSGSRRAVWGGGLAMALALVMEVIG